jgi:hypothetical protein
LPAAQEVSEQIGDEPIKTEDIYYRIGFQIGSLDDQGKAYFHNHYDIQIEYHSKKDLNRVVGVIVTPYSSKTIDRSNGCDYYGKPKTLSLSETSENKFSFTYNVYWTVSRNVNGVLLLLTMPFLSRLQLPGPLVGTSTCMYLILKSTGSV